tara:strand:+ start:187 stop:336 length:150 start_codon:yes stop_codon:yes gene_type:complete
VVNEWRFAASSPCPIRDHAPGREEREKEGEERTVRAKREREERKREYSE